MARRQAIDGQTDTNRTSNGVRDTLFEPIPEDRGARGRFNDQAKNRSWRVLLSQNRGPVSLVLLAAAAATVTVVRSLCHPGAANPANDSINVRWRHVQTPRRFRTADP